jgi:phage shock protein A
MIVEQADTLTHSYDCLKTEHQELKTRRSRYANSSAGKKASTRANRAMHHLKTPQQTATDEGWRVQNHFDLS